MINVTRLYQPDHYPIYAFCQPGQPGWSLVACHPNDRSPVSSAREMFPDLFDWHLSELALNALRPITGKTDLLGRRYRNTFSGHRDPSWAWDDVEQCWRAPNETIMSPPHVETIERLGVSFAQPDYGWIDLTLSTPTQSVEWPLSEVYDPFRSELTSWMEAVAERSQPRLFVYVEHMHARLDVIPAESSMVILVAHSVAVEPEKPPLAVKMPRSAFVRDFYSALVSFWEGEELRKNWNSWLCGVEDWAPGEDERGYWVTEPWPIRSEKVERYLAACGA